MKPLEKGTYLGKVSRRNGENGIFAGVTSYNPDDGSDLPHYHEHPHLSFMIRGGGVVKLRSREIERLPGEIVFFHAGEPHQCIGKRFPTNNVNLEIELAFLSNHEIDESDINLSVRANPNAKFIMLKMYKELLLASDLSGTSIRMLLLEMISGMQKPKGYPRWVGIVRELMNDRWNEKLSLEDLSAVAGVHPVTISKYFPIYFSCTFGEHMRRLKIEKSLRMIKDSPNNLAEVAYACGFYDQSHFVRTFKSMTGFLPSTYAKL